MFCEGLGEGNSVWAQDAAEKCMALHVGGRMAPKEEANNGRDGRTLSMTKEGTLSMSNDLAVSDCS